MDDHDDSDLLARLRNYAQLEVGLALLCIVTPGFLLWADGGMFRNSISAYFDMEQTQIYYFPLTVAAMLFLVNGFMKHEHYYNIWLGAALSLVVLLNHDDFTVLHIIFAIAFFGGNAGVMLFLSKGKEITWMLGFAVGMAVLALVAWRGFGWPGLLTLEWVSLIVIAVHFIADASDGSYAALQRGENP